MDEVAILKAIRDADLALEEEKADALTGPEIAEKLSVSESTVRRRLRALLKLGKVEVVRVRREGIDGRIQPVTAYKCVSG